MPQFQGELKRYEFELKHFIGKISLEYISKYVADKCF